MRTLRDLALPSLFLAVSLASAGCGALGYPVGSVYTGTHVPAGMMRLQGAGPNKGGDAKGEACATGILGVAAFGDASLAAAKKAGGISDVQSVEFRGLSILGIYTQGCTIAYGPGGTGDRRGQGGGGGGGGGAAAAGAAGVADADFARLRGLGLLPPGGGGMAPVAPGASVTPGGSTQLVPPGVPHSGTPAPAPSHKYDLTPFDIQCDGNDYSCISLDASQLKPGFNPTAEKSTFNNSFFSCQAGRRAHLVEHCPTDNVLATMEETGAKARVGESVKHFYYRAPNEADRPRWEAYVALQQAVATLAPAYAVKTFTWVVQPAPIPKPPADTAPVVFACNDLGGRRCTAYGPDANANLLKSGKEFCANGEAAGTRKVVPRCPSQGMVGRCELHRTFEQGSVDYHYNGDPVQLATDRDMCERASGSWSAP